jgi:uncharacterized protein YjiS (DUF1127 family)
MQLYFASVDGGMPRIRPSMRGAAHWGGSSWRLVRAMTRLLGAWRRRAYERRLLAQFGERERRDLALTPSDIGSEIAKPFWRE